MASRARRPPHLKPNTARVPIDVYKFYPNWCGCPTTIPDDVDTLQGRRSTRNRVQICVGGWWSIAMTESLLAWFAMPLSGSATHNIAGCTAWHARLMVLAWGILLPMGALIARFYKVRSTQDWPRQLDNKTWWHAHRWMQSIAVVFMTVGLMLAFGAGQRDSVAASVHVWLGWFLCLTGWLQVAAGVLRGSKGGPTDTQVRGDHYDMSRWRCWFERLHKGQGWLAIVIAVPTIAIGLKVSDAPRWMALVLTFWWIGLGIWFVRLQALGRCMDTYQAIWGPEELHPGNRMPPIGWGVRRYTARSWRKRSGSRTTQTN